MEDLNAAALDSYRRSRFDDSYKQFSAALAAAELLPDVPDGTVVSLLCNRAASALALRNYDDGECSWPRLALDLWSVCVAVCMCSACVAMCALQWFVTAQLR
jgi:hypothetical protein